MRCCIKLGIFLAQVLAYPQKKPMCPFCPRWRDSANRVRRTGFASTQVLVVQRKKRVVHTQGPALLLRLCFYKDIKEEDRRTTGKAQRRPMRYAGQTLAMEKTGNPGVGSQVWGLQGVPGAFKGRQAVHNALDDINGWGGRCNGAVRARPLGGAGGAGQVVRTAHRRQKLWARRGKPAQGADNTLSPSGLA